MANSCITDYHIIGSKKEISELYNLMKSLERNPESRLSNDWGNTWLGNLVDALGGNWKEVYCRGYWMSLDIDEDGCGLTLTTDTAWAPMCEVNKFLEQKFPSFKIYYIAEEDGCGVYMTNDVYGKFYPWRWKVNICTKEECCEEYFEYFEEAAVWIANATGKEVLTPQDIEALSADLSEENPDWYVYLEEFEVVND